MTGNNQFHLNQATMIEALQMYFDATFRDGEAPQVRSIGISNDADFVVKVTEKEVTQELTFPPIHSSTGVMP